MKQRVTGQDGTVRRSVLRKLIIVVLIGIAITALCTTVMSAFRESSQYIDGKTHEFLGTAHVFASAVADPLHASDRNAALRSLRAIAKIPSFQYIRVVGSNGKIFAELGRAVMLKTDSAVPIWLRNKITVQVDVVKSGRTIGKLVLVAKTSDFFDHLIEGLITAIIAAFLAAGIGVAVAYRLQKKITEPLTRLSDAMTEVRKTHNFRQSLSLQSDDETGVLIQSFNDMMMQISDRDDRLAEHLENLENEVEMRTHELVIAKDVAEQANAAKSDFLATMSHEIRTPMNGMLVMAEMLASAELLPRYQRYADIVVKSGQSLLSIINDILDFSKIESGKLELEQVRCNPGEIIDDILNLFWEKATSKGLDLAAYIAPDVPEVILADPVRLNQILTNLVNNALKFTSSGHVLVSMDSLPKDPNGKNERLEFRVTDTGIGVAAEKLDTIFEAFGQEDQSTTRKFGGTGLGLAICRRLVEAMDGEITAESAAGRGATFRFSISCRFESASTNPGFAADERRLKKAIVATDGSATSEALIKYLHDFGIEADDRDAAGLTDVLPATADLIVIDPNLVGNLPELGAGRKTGQTPYIVCLSQMGDNLTDHFLDAGRVDDQISRPLARSACYKLFERLNSAAPAGRQMLHPRPEAKKDLPKFANARVLVADDSAVNREVVLEALKRFDVIGHVVENGRMALDVVMREPFDFIFMDASMPEMDGFEATRQIRAWEEAEGKPRTPIVALTAHVAGLPADEWRLVGMDAYLTKPFRLADLSNALQEFMPGHNRTSNAIAGEGDEDRQNDNAAPDGQNTKTPVIDIEIIDSLREMQSKGGDDLVDRLFGLFRQHVPVAISKIEEALQGSQTGSLADAAHALKSMSNNIGARRLAEFCGRLEQDAIDEEPLDATCLRDQLDIELKLIYSRIDELSRACGNEDPAAPSRAAATS